LEFSPTTIEKPGVEPQAKSRKRSASGFEARSWKLEEKKNKTSVLEARSLKEIVMSLAFNPLQSKTSIDIAAFLYRYRKKIAPLCFTTAVAWCPHAPLYTIL
jgi:hypothetical protein